MAEKKKPASPPRAQPKETKEIKKEKLPEPVPKKKRNFFGMLLKFFIFIIILGVGFAAGVYLNVIDLPTIAQKYKLYDYPLLSSYLPKPQTNFETVPLEQEPAKEQKPLEPSPSPAPQPTDSEKRELDKAELEKQIKARQQEEAKKITKAARLYNTMKPEEAVSIMNQLDDEAVLTIFSRMEEEQVAKILALFEAKRAASITQSMMKVKPVLASKPLSNSN